MYSGNIMFFTMVFCIVYLCDVDLKPDDACDESCGSCESGDDSLLFTTILSHQAAQKVVDDLREHHGCGTQNGGARPRDHATGRVGIGHILQ